jgi:hypothetical protein
MEVCMANPEDGFIRTALVCALGMSREFRNKFDDWKQWYMIKGEAELEEWKGIVPSTKADIDALARKIDRLSKEEKAYLLRDHPKQP